MSCRNIARSRLLTHLITRNSNNSISINISKPLTSSSSLLSDHQSSSSSSSSSNSSSSSSKWWKVVKFGAFSIGTAAIGTAAYATYAFTLDEVEHKSRNLHAISDYSVGDDAPALQGTCRKAEEKKRRTFRSGNPKRTRCCSRQNSRCF